MPPLAVPASAAVDASQSLPAHGFRQVALALSRKVIRPLPFHPLDLGGDAALHALFGFVVEGRPQPADIDAESVRLTGFQVSPAHSV